MKPTGAEGMHKNYVEAFTRVQTQLGTGVDLYEWIADYICVLLAVQDECKVSGDMRRLHQCELLLQEALSYHTKATTAGLTEHCVLKGIPAEHLIREAEDTYSTNQTIEHISKRLQERGWSGDWARADTAG
jgi:hypothetical protein